MSYLPAVTKAKRVRGFILRLRFDDGTEKHVDVSQWFRGIVFKPLKDPKFFGSVFLEGGTIAWPNGVDIAPEALYGSVDVRNNQKKRTKARAGTRTR